MAEERLELDIGPALDGIETIENALTAAAQSFKVGLAEALDLLTNIAVGDVDASSVTTSIDSAVEAADLAPEVEADASGVTVAIDDAVGASDTDVTVEADASDVTPEIDAAVDAADGTVDIEAVVDSVTDEIEAAVADADATVEIDADVSGATDAIEGLSDVASGAGGGIGSLNVGVAQLDSLSQAATGSLAGLEGGIAATHPAAAGAAAAVAALGASALGLFHAALDSDTATRRFNEALGDMAQRVESIHIEGFADSLGELAEKAGSDDEAMRLAAARIADLGNSAEASDEQIATTAENILLLATRATVLNPTLGDAGDVANRLTDALARGGRALRPFGIALDAASIKARAVADAGGDASAATDGFALSAAGAAIVTEKLGGHLQSDIVEGAKGTEISLRSLREEFKNTLEDLGKPLLEPVIESIRAGQPILIDLAEVLAHLATVILPVVLKAFQAAAPIVGVLADAANLVLTPLGLLVGLLDKIPTPVLTAVTAVFALKAAFAGLGAVLGAGEGIIAGVGGIGAAIGSLFTPMGALVVSVGLLAAAWSAHAKAQAESNARVKEGAAAFAEEGKSVGQAIDAITKKRIPENQLDDIRRMGLNYKTAGELAKQGGEGVQTFIDKAEASGEITSSVADALRKNGGDVHDLNVNYQALGVTSHDLQESNLDLIETFNSLSAEVQKSAKAALEQLSATGSLTAEQQELVDAVLASNSGNLDYVSIVAKIKSANHDAAGGADDLTGALGDQADQAADTTEKLQALYDATIAFVDSNIAAEESAIKFKDSLGDVAEKQAALTTALATYKAGSKEATAAQKDLDDAIRSARDAAVDNAKAQVRLAQDTETANGRTLSAEDAQRIFVESLQASAAQADGPTKQAIANLLATAEGLNAFRSVQLQVEADTAEAERRLKSVQTIIDRLNRSDVLVGVRLPGSNAAMAGGSFEGPTFLTVGEAGREVMFIEEGTRATVIPNGPTEKLLAGGMGSSAAIDYDELARALARHIGTRPTGDINVWEAADPIATAEAVAVRVAYGATR